MDNRKITELTVDEFMEIISRKRKYKRDEDVYSPEILLFIEKMIEPSLEPMKSVDVYDEFWKLFPGTQKQKIGSHLKKFGYIAKLRHVKSDVGYWYYLRIRTLVPPAPVHPA